eukprot:22782-Prorocentrum_minimum.AAC.1
MRVAAAATTHVDMLVPSMALRLLIPNPNPNPNPNPHLGEVLPREGGSPGGDRRGHAGPLHGAEGRVLGAVAAIGLKVIRLTILLTQRGD